MVEIDKGEQQDTYCDEHWIMYRIVESLYCTSETKVTLRINYTSLKIRKK